MRAYWKKHPFQRRVFAFLMLPLLPLIGVVAYVREYIPELWDELKYGYRLSWRAIIGKAL